MRVQNNKAPHGTQPQGARRIAHRTPRKPSWINAASTLIVTEFLDQRQDQLTVYEMAVVRFIQNRTLKWGKRSESIPMHHFLDGVRAHDGALVCSGLPMSRSTLRRSLASLIEDDWVIRENLYGTDGGDDANQYSLNLSKFRIDNEEQVVHRHIATAACLQSISITPVTYMGMPERAAEQAEELANKNVYAILNSRKNAEKEEEEMLKKPKNPRPTGAPITNKIGGSTQDRGGVHTGPPNSNNYVITVNNIKTFTDNEASPRIGGTAEVDNVMERVARQHEAKRSKSLSKLSGYLSLKSMTTVDLQRAVDAIQKEMGGDRPRVLITTKAFGLFRRRMADFQVNDVRHFLEFILENWEGLAARYNYGIRKASQEGRPSRASAMTEYPDYWILATKLPWFMRHYNDHLTGAYRSVEERSAHERVAELEKENAVLIRQAAQAKAASRRTSAQTGRAQSVVASIRENREREDEPIGLGDRTGHFLRPRRFGE